MATAEAAFTEAPAQDSQAPPAESQQPAKKAPLLFGKMGVILTDLASLWRFAEIIHKSGLAPDALDSVEKIVIAIQFGAEFGVAPMASVRCVVVVGGTPSWKGDMALALCRRSGLMAEFKTWHEGEGESRKALVLSRRSDTNEPKITEFSVAHAILAGLWGRTSRSGEPMPWKAYPDRMLYYRALGFNLRDNFPEVMVGAHTAEELAESAPIDVSPTSATSIARPTPVAGELGPAPAEDPLLVGLGIGTAAAKPAEDFVLVEPAAKASQAKKATAKKVTPAAKPRIDPAVCNHEAIPPSRVAALPQGRSIVCPACNTDLRSDPIQAT